MSANQIPGPPLRDSDWPGRPREHSCATCEKNGGAGHTLAALRTYARVEPEYQDETPVALIRRTCAYWSARRREHCGSTEKVEVHGAIGSRCVSHHPELMNAVYAAVVAEAKS